MLANQGARHEAVAYYQRAIQRRPDLAFVHNNLGAAMAGLGMELNRPADIIECDTVLPVPIGNFTQQVQGVALMRIICKDLTIELLGRSQVARLVVLKTPYQ